MRSAAVISLVMLSLSTACSWAPSGSEQGSEDTDTDTGEVCEPPVNATPSETATIRVRNDRDVQIYVLPYSSFSCNYGKVEIDVAGEPVLWQHPGTYAYDCSEPLCDWGCSDGGDMGWIINPGATAELEWNGGVWTDVPLSDACRAEAGCLNDPGPTCEVLELVEGEYNVRVNLTATCFVEDECMACTEGVCEVFFYEPSTGDVSESFEASAVFPASVEIVVD